MKTRGGEERVVKECALFIPADTSESLIHLKNGISQVTTISSLACTHGGRHIMNTHPTANDLLDGEGCNYRSGSLNRTFTTNQGPSLFQQLPSSTAQFP